MIKYLVFSLLISVPCFLPAQEIDLLILNYEYDKALGIIDNRLSTDANQPMLLLKKGIILQKKYDYTGAMQSFNMAYRLDSLDANILLETADLNSNIGDHKRALPYLKTLYYHDSINTVKTLKLARGYINLRIYDKPFKILQSAFKRDSSNLQINKNLAICALRLDKTDLAISLYLKIIKLNPSDLSNYLNLASAYQSKKEETNVIGTLEYGLRIFPGEPQLLMRLGDFQFQTKKYSRAVISYEKFLSSGDSAIMVMRNLGICYFFEKQPRKGRYLLDKILSVAPDDPIAALYLGLCYKDLGQLKKSIEYLKFAAEIAIPIYLTDIYQHLGYVYNLNKEYRKGITALLKSYELDPSQADVLFQIATTYEILKVNKSLPIKYYDAYLKSVNKEKPASQKYVEYAGERLRVLKDGLVTEKNNPVKN